MGRDLAFLPFAKEPLAHDLLDDRTGGVNVPEEKYLFATMRNKLNRVPSC